MIANHKGAQAMRAYKDLEGTQLAEEGDLVAMVTGEHSGWYCPDVARRPVMKNGKPCFEGSYDQDGDTMTQTANQLIE